MNSIEEFAHNIDPDSNLVGVAAIPEVDAMQKRPGIILINAGFLHRVGPNRMNTTLARKLAAAGFASLRMDLSGLGDSQGNQGGASVSDDYESVSRDLDKAMQLMQDQYGIDSFVLFGLCSGAYDTARKAIRDTRVVGLMNIDGAGYRTRRFYTNHVLMHLLRRVVQPGRWRRLYSRYRANVSLRSEGVEVSNSVLMNATAYTDWTLEEAGRYFEQLAHRNVRMHFVYTGGVSGFYNYHGQFWDMFKAFDFNGMVSTDYFPSTDHLMLLQHQRNEVHRNIVSWVERSFSQSR